MGYIGLVNGESAGVKAIKANWDYIMGFEKSLEDGLDEVGVQAAQDMAEALPVGKVRLPHYQPKMPMIAI